MISQQESNSMTILRAFSMFMIVLCHIFQAYNHGFAYIFDVGVQVFFIMSGFLYGFKDVSNWAEWYKRRLFKLYIPYIIVAFSVMLVHVLAQTADVRWYNIIGYITNLHGWRQVFDFQQLNVSGLNHLWFMTAIMFAYFTTPLAQHLKKNSFLYLCLMLSILVPMYIYFPTRILWGLEWGWLYLFGYFFANLYTKERTLICILFIIAFLTILPFIHSGTDVTIYSRTGRIFHCVLGITIFNLGLLLLHRVPKVPYIITLFDKHSFYIFLAHFPLMVGALSLAHITGNYYLNIVLMLMASVITTIILEFCTKRFQKLF